MVELLVVIVLISLVATFTIPKIRTNLYSDQLKATARRLIGLVTEASQDAVSGRSESFLNFDLEHNLVSIGGATNEGEGERPAGRKDLTLPDSVEVVDIQSFHGGKYTRDKVTVHFNNKGYTDKTAIHLRADDGREMTIVLSPFMGTVRVFDAYLELEDDRIHL